MSANTGALGDAAAVKGRAALPLRWVSRLDAGNSRPVPQEPAIFRNALRLMGKDFRSCVLARVVRKVASYQVRTQTIRSIDYQFFSDSSKRVFSLLCSVNRRCRILSRRGAQAGWMSEGEFWQPNAIARRSGLEASKRKTVCTGLGSPIKSHHVVMVYYRGYCFAVCLSNFSVIHQ